jgi:hypothetical protein
MLDALESDDNITLVILEKYLLTVNFLGSILIEIRGANKCSQKRCRAALCYMEFSLQLTIPKSSYKIIRT